jgi:PAS domain S-box-containing protein
MTPPLVPLLVLASLLIALIGAYAFAKRPLLPQNRAFFLLTLCATTWTLSIAATIQGLPNPTRWMRISFCAASLMPLLILWVIRPLALPLPRTADSVIKILSVFGLAWAAASLSPYMVSRVDVVAHAMFVRHGPLHRPFAVYILTTLSIAAWITIRAHARSAGRRRIQLKYLWLGFLVPAAFVTMTNLLIPLLFKSSRFSAYGPLAGLFMVSIIGHAIIRHRLMDIRVAIRRSVVYVAAVAVAGGLLFGLLVATRAFFPEAKDVSLREIVLALLVAALFHPLKSYIQRTFDRYVYREPYDFQRTIQQTSRALAATIELPLLLKTIGDAVENTLRPESLAIYLADREGGQLCRVVSFNAAALPEVIPHASPLSGAAQAHVKLIFRDELPDARTSHRVAGLTDALDSLSADAVVALVAEDRLVGLLVLGPKKSGDAFFSDDAALLATLADQAAVAVRNAQLHQEVVNVSLHLQNILSRIDSGVVAVGPTGYVTLFNTAAERMLGLSAETARRQPIQHGPISLSRMIEATLVDGTPRSQFEIAVPDATGQILPIACSTAVLRAPNGSVVGAVAVFSDMSRLKELEAEKQRAERLAALEAIASGLVHEIRNPLVVVKTFTQLLPARFDDPAFREQFLRVAARALARIDHLLDRFRTLAAPLSAPMEPVDVRDPMRSTLEALGPTLEERRIQLRQVAHGTPPHVLGNALQLQQVFHNLCLNAIEAMTAGGELTVRIADLTETGGNTLLVEISDTGVGIPEDLLATIFDPFVTTKATGTGLGLAICRSIADVHHAALHARNNTGRPGATFTLEFPIPSGRPAKLMV